MAFQSDTDVLAEMAATTTADILELDSTIETMFSEENASLSTGAYDQVHVVKPDFSDVDTVRTTNRAGRNADYGAADDVEAAAITMTADNKSQIVVDIPAADQEQTRWGVVEAVARDAALKHANDSASDMVAAMNAATTHAVGSNPNASANGNAGSIALFPEVGDFTSATDGSWIAVDGTPNTKGDGNEDIGLLILKHLRRAATYAKRANFMGANATTVVGSDPGQVMAFAAPEVWVPALDYLETLGIALEPITMPILRDGAIEEGQPSGVLGTYRGITIAESTDIKRPAAAANGWPIYVGTSRAMQRGALPVISQLLSPTTNQTGPRWSFRSTRFTGIKLINAPLLTKVLVNSGA